jgi:cytochrome b561
MKLLSKEKATPHSLPVKIIHWAFVGLFIWGISKGLDNVSQLADTALFQFEMIFSGIFLAVIVARFLITRRQPTSLPADTPKLTYMAARSAHLGLYAFPALIAISGLMIGAIYAFSLPTGLAIALHEFSISATYVFIAAHITAALGHRLLGDGVWSSMVPVFKE